jgi:hypothetical protein
MTQDQPFTTEILAYAAGKSDYPTPFSARRVDKANLPGD